jgi:hypothetical protein
MIFEAEFSAERYRLWTASQEGFRSGIHGYSRKIGAGELATKATGTFVQIDIQISAKLARAGGNRQRSGGNQPGDAPTYDGYPHSHLLIPISSLPFISM